MDSSNDWKDWATVVWKSTHSTPQSFIWYKGHMENYIKLYKNRSSSLLHILQGDCSVADYAIDFCTLAAASGRNDSGNIWGLRPRTLLRSLAFWLDNQLRVLQRELQSLWHATYGVASQLTNKSTHDDTEPLQGPEPMQIGVANFCLQGKGSIGYKGEHLHCGQEDHWQSACPLRKPKGKGRHESGDPWWPRIWPLPWEVIWLF